MFNSNDQRVEYDYDTYARLINYSEMTHILRSKAPELVEARTVEFRGTDRYYWLGRFSKV